MTVRSSGGAVPPTAGGGQWVGTCDPVDLALADQADLAVSLYFAGPSGPASWHPAGLSSGYRAPGNHGADPGADAFGGFGAARYFLDGVDVVNPGVHGAVVAFGPSTTDGIGSAADANQRYPDELARPCSGCRTGSGCRC